MKDIAYKRVLLKLSGEALAGERKNGVDAETLGKICDKIKEIVDMGVEVSIVVGGGNFWRGRYGHQMERTTSDYMGMLATVMNAIALQSSLRSMDVSTRVMTAIAMNQIAEPYVRFRAIRHLEKGRVVIFAAGTGNPFFTTDTASALRASEIDAQAMLMAKNGVNGVYSDDPKTNKNAKKYDTISYDDIIMKGLKVMDTAACDLCKQNKVPMVVFDFKEQGSICKILKGEKIGTFVGD